MNETDAQIKELLNQVEKQKKDIKKAERPNWATNCNFEYIGGGRFNVMTVGEQELTLALAYLLTMEQNYKVAAKKLDCNSSFAHGGFSVAKWTEDFTTRISQIRVAQKKQDLDVMEKRLSAIISPNLKAHMEIEDIKKALGA